MVCFISFNHHHTAYIVVRGESTYIYWPMTPNRMEPKKLKVSYTKSNLLLLLGKTMTFETCVI